MSSNTVRWTKRAGIWIGIGINPASISLGGGLAARVSFAPLMIVMPLAAILLASLVTLSGIVGRRNQSPLAKWATNTFGNGFGSNLINLMMGLGMVGWGGFQIGLSGTGLANILQSPPWLGMALAASLIFVCGLIGLNRVSGLVWVTTGASIALALVSLVAVNAGSISDRVAAAPSAADFLWVVTSVIGYATLFAMRSVDFTWEMASDRDVIYNGIAFFSTLMIALMVGVLLFHATGDWNIADILASTNFATLGHLFMIVSLISPAISGLHSGSLAFSSITPLSYRFSTILLMGCAFLLGITRFDRQLLPFLGWLGSILPPALVILLLTSFMQRMPSQRVTIGAWLGGALVALLLKIGGSPFDLVVGAATAALILGVWGFRPK